MCRAEHEDAVAADHVSGQTSALVHVANRNEVLVPWQASIYMPVLAYGPGTRTEVSTVAAHTLTASPEYRGRVACAAQATAVLMHWWRVLADNSNSGLLPARGGHWRTTRPMRGRSHDRAVPVLAADDAPALSTGACTAYTHQRQRGKVTPEGESANCRHTTEQTDQVCRRRARRLSDR